MGLKSIGSRYYCQAQLLLLLRVPIYRDEAISLGKRVAPILNGLPAQERVGYSIDDIPDVGRVGLVQSDCGYIPCRS
jgi:hypothetical protein